MDKKARLSEQLYLKLNTPRGTDLWVVGAFSEGVYLRDVRDGIYLLHDRKYGVIPFGIGIGDSREWIWQNTPKVGACAAIRDGKFSFSDAVDEWELEPWTVPECMRRCPDEQQCRQAVCRGIELLKRGKTGLGAMLLPGMEETGGKGRKLFLAQAKKGVERLTAGLRENCPDGIDEGLNMILGLGFGLTPSMDDFLTGFLYTLQYARLQWKLQIPEAELLADRVRCLIPRCTVVFSVPYLLAAAQAEPFSVFENLLAQLPESLSGDPARRLLEIGSSSGNDMLSGILYALMYLDRREPFEI